MKYQFQNRLAHGTGVFAEKPQGAFDQIMKRVKHASALGLHSTSIYLDRALLQDLTSALARTNLDWEMGPDRRLILRW